MYRNFLKPLLDFISALLALLILSPIIIAVWLLLLIVNKGSPFFYQNRPGQGSHIFKIVKFKTMNDRKDSKGDLLPDSVRLTKIGAIVRKLSIDELPQLYNVLMGHMSIIGPRPLLPEYLSLYTKEQARRHEVKPGISGWAQINGRNSITWQDKFKKDVWYVNNQTFFLDIKILWMTVMKVVIREGINTQGQVTTTKFTGNND